MMRWLLLAAYLPVLTFFGHWPLSIDIPGTSLYVGLPDSGSSHGHDHKNHCHADAGSCSDVPLTSTATVAALAESLLLIAGDPPLIGVAEDGVAWLAQANVTPTLPPPESAFQS
jgi:hypothetical protein